MLTVYAARVFVVRVENGHVPQTRSLAIRSRRAINARCCARCRSARGCDSKTLLRIQVRERGAEFQAARASASVSWRCISRRGMRRGLCLQPPQLPTRNCCSLWRPANMCLFSRDLALRRGAELPRRGSAAQAAASERVAERTCIHRTITALMNTQVASTAISSCSIRSSGMSLATVVRLVVDAIELDAFPACDLRTATSSFTPEL